jgi:hypothetical protein
MAVPEEAKEQSIKLFEQLGVCRQLAESAVSLGWKSPTSIQEQAIPHLLGGIALSSLQYHNMMLRLSFLSSCLGSGHAKDCLCSQARMLLASRRQDPVRRAPLLCQSCR